MWNIHLRVTRTGEYNSPVHKNSEYNSQKHYHRFHHSVSELYSDLLFFGSIKLHFSKALALHLHSKMRRLRPNLYVTQKVQILNYALGFVEAKYWSNPANIYARFSGNLNCVNPYWGTRLMHSISFNPKLLVNHSLGDLCTEMDFIFFWINYANSAVFTSSKLDSCLNSIE